MREEKVGESSERHLTGRTDKFIVIKVPRQCPPVLQVKVGSSNSEAVGSETA
jgi:hypothetical protein